MTELILDKQKEEQEISILQAESTDLAIRSDRVIITNLEEAELTAEQIKLIANTIRKIEDKRREFTSPINLALDNINATFRKLKEPLERARNNLSDLLARWRNAENERVRIEKERIEKEEARRRKIQESHKAAGHEVSEPIVMKRPEPIVNKIGATHTRKTWTFEVLDLDKIPKRFFTLDETLIRRAIAEGAREIEGLRIYLTEKIVIR